MSLFKKLMMTMLVVGVAGAVVGTGTFASFNAIVDNSGNTFSTGQITFSTTDHVSAACLAGPAAGSTTTCATSFFFNPGTTLAAGDARLGTLTLTNGGSIPVGIQLSVTASSGSNALTTNSGIGAEGANTGSPSLGFLIFECETSGGGDNDCNSTGNAKLLPLYGTCGSSSGVISITSATINSAWAASKIIPAGSTSNAVKVDTNPSCAGGNTTTGTPTLVPITSSLAASGVMHLAVLAYLPESATNGLQNLTSTTLDFTWTATQLTGAAS